MRARINALGEWLYERWLYVRTYFGGVRTAWVSVASVVVGFWLLLISPEARDLFLEVGHPIGDWQFWALFYVSVIFAWALPVFVSARWILTRLEAGPDRAAPGVAGALRVRIVVPAVLVVGCFAAVLTGQLLASINAIGAGDDDRQLVRVVQHAVAKYGDCEGEAACLDARLRLVGASIAQVVDGTRAVLLIMGLSALIGGWFYLGRSSLLSMALLVVSLAIICSLISAAILGASLQASILRARHAIDVPIGELVRAGMQVAFLYLPPFIVIFLAGILVWLQRLSVLWWLGSFGTIMGAALLAAVLYGIVWTEIALTSPYGLVHLPMLGFLTIAAAVVAWWGLSPQPDGRATRIGQALLRLLQLLKLARVDDPPTDKAAMARLINPIFLALLVLSVAMTTAALIVDPVSLTGPFLHRALLLPVILGVPVAVVTYVTYWSARWHTPLVLLAIVGLGALSVGRAMHFGDNLYTVRTVAVEKEVAPPSLHKALTQWAAANKCNLRKKSGNEDPRTIRFTDECLGIKPIIVVAAGGGSRAAFHAANFLGELLDDGKFAPLRGHKLPVYSAAISPDGQLIVTASGDGTARLWDAQTGRPIQSLDDHTGRGRVSSAQFSHDSKRVVTAAWDRTAIVWDVSDPLRPKLIWKLEGHRDGVNSAAFSPDGKYVVTASKDKTARIWDAEKGVLIGTLAGHTSWVYSARFSHDGKRVVTAGWDRIAIIWDVEDPQQPKLIRKLEGHNGDLNSAAFSPDSKLVVTASDDMTARIWDAQTGRQIQPLAGHTAWVYSAQFSPDGKRVVTAAWDKTAIIWDVSDPQQPKKVRDITGHLDDVNSAAFSADGKLIVTASDDKTARVWDASGQPYSWPVATRPFHRQLLAISSVSGGSLAAAITYAALADSQRRAAPGDGPAESVLKPPCSKIDDREWDVRSWVGYRVAGVPGFEPVDPQESWKDCLQLLVAGDFLSPVAIRLVSHDWLPFHIRPDRAQVLEEAWEERYVRLTGKDRRKGEKSTLARSIAEVRQLILPEGDQEQKGWLPILLLNGTAVDDGRRIVTSDVETLLRDDSDKVTADIFLDAHSLHPLLSDRSVMLQGHTGLVLSAALSPDRRLVVTGSSDKTARLWDADTKKELAQLVGHTQQVNSVQFSPDGKRVLTAAWDRTVIIWDVSNPRRPRLIGDLTGHRGDVNSAAFSPDGKLIVTASDDRTARLWDAETRKELGRLEGHKKLVYNAEFSPDNKRVVTASWDGTAMIWDVLDPARPRPIMELKGHAADVNSAAFSPDSKLVVTASDDGTARIWDAKTGETLGTLEGHTAWVYSAQFSPDSKRVVTGAWDKTAIIWDVSNPRQPRPIKELRGHTGKVHRAALSADGKLVVTASHDKTARVWSTKVGMAQDISLSTAVTMSARFPIISPTGVIRATEAGTVSAKSVARVVDGGYHENFGAITAMEFARAVSKEYELEPVVVLINNDPTVKEMRCVEGERRGPADPEPPATSWFPTLFSPYTAVENTRTARGLHAAVSLCEDLREGEEQPGKSRRAGPAGSRFFFIKVGKNLNKDLPVSWWLSKHVQRFLDRQRHEPGNLKAVLAIRSHLAEKRSEQAGPPGGLPLPR